MVSRLAIDWVRGGLKALRALLIAAILLSIPWIWSAMPQPAILATPAPDPPPEPFPGRMREALAWYAPLWERDLKQLPVPSAGEQPDPAPDSSDSLPTLLATFVEPGGCYAHFIRKNGRVEFKGLNETIGAFQVMAIEPGRVELRDGDRSVWVEIPRPEKP